MEYCRIHISSSQDPAAMLAALLHEMVHQYQVEVLHMEADHGGVFKAYCRHIERRTNGLTLR